MGLESIERHFQNVFFVFEMGLKSIEKYFQIFLLRMRKDDGSRNGDGK